MFKGLFGKKKPVEDKAFTDDFNDALARYMDKPDGGVVEISLKDKQGTVVPPNVIFADAYEEWKGIISVPDRRAVIFKVLDEMMFEKNPIERNVERFVIDRYPREALKYSMENATEEDYRRPEFLTAMARCYFFLSDYEKSIELANQALAIDSENKKAMIALADSLHLSNRHDESHALYDKVLQRSKMKDWEKEEISLFEIVCFRHDILHSSVYAAGLLMAEQVDTDTWDEVANEFYHCPYFRSQHAFLLFKKHEALKGMAKLISLTQEFPYFKEAVLAAKSGILQFREKMKSADLWDDELIYLNGIIKENEWELDQRDEEHQ